MPAITRIGVLTGGGDAPRLNAVIRAVVKSAANSGIQTVGIEDSFDGLLEMNRSRVLTPRDVTGILRLGGTILGTLNTGNPVTLEVQTSDGPFRYADRVLDIYHRLGLDAVVAIGGDGTLAISHEFCAMGMPIVCVHIDAHRSAGPEANGRRPRYPAPPQPHRICKDALP